MLSLKTLIYFQLQNQRLWRQKNEDILNVSFYVLENKKSSCIPMKKIGKRA